MSSAKKTSTTQIQLDDEIESTTPILHQAGGQEDIDPLEKIQRKVLANLRNEQDKLKHTLIENFAVPPGSASDLVISMADMCSEFSRFVVKVGSYQEDASDLTLDNLLHNFFNHRGWGLLHDWCIDSTIPGPWSTHVLNEFLLNTVAYEIPFVYLTGEKVEVLAIPNSDFWSDFKASLKATDDWDSLQSHSRNNLNSRSIVGHAAKSALACLLAKLDVSCPDDSLDILFRYIDTARLLELFGGILEYEQDDARETRKIGPDDYVWDDFREELGREAVPGLVNLHSQHQVDEFMNIYKDFRGTFIGYEMDLHGILRFREFRGWPAYVSYRDRYTDPTGTGNQTLH